MTANVETTAPKAIDRLRTKLLRKSATAEPAAKPRRAATKPAKKSAAKAERTTSANVERTTAAKTEPAEKPAKTEKAKYRRPWLRIGPLLLLVIYLAIMAAITLGPGDPEAAAGAGASDNYTPFAEINRSLADGGLRSLAQIVGNALLFVPFGILVPLAFPRLSIVTAVLAAAAASAVVELVQLTHLAGRMFDIDDVFLNVAGALFGGLLVAISRGVAALIRLVRR